MSNRNDEKRDKYGNYVNKKDVRIKINTDKNGKEHISFYDSEVDQPHGTVHVNIDYQDSSWTSTTHSEDRTDTEHSSGECYLTSACMMHFQENFDDNCEELMILRWFRDNFVPEEEIQHYYEIAPAIVQKINEVENNDYIYNYIYEFVVSACVSAIKSGNYKFAYERYKNNVIALEAEFVKPQFKNEVHKLLKLK